MKLKIGSHVGMSGKDMLLGSAKEAYSYGANVSMCLWRIQVLHKIRAEKK